MMEMQKRHVKGLIIMKVLYRVITTLSIALATSQARALPVLQLDIAGGTYDSVTETIIASGNTFSLYAYGLSSGIALADNFFLSMALLPSTSTAGVYGSFTINGTPVSVTSDMTYGIPPLETVLGGAAFDPGDLGKHNIFPTYFAEKKFNFSSSDQSGLYNTADNSGWGPQAGTEMYYKKFDFNIAGLTAGRGIHFDLYNETLITACKKSGSCTVGDIDVNKFAPFSHDAEGYVVASIPEPETYAMLLAGLGLMGFVARRRKGAL